MKKYYLIAVAFLTIFSNSLSANEGFYFKGSGGGNWLDINKDIKDNNKIGYLVTGAVGYKFCNGFSLEGEYGYRQNNNKYYERYFVDSSDNSEMICTRERIITFRVKDTLITQTYIAHILYDFPLNFYGIRPYVGWGLGYARQCAHIKTNVFHKVHLKRKGFAWDIRGGFAYPICKNVGVELEARYLNTGGKTDDVSLCAGLKYYLN
jgi:opacity protein-like surface antigen